MNTKRLLLGFLPLTLLACIPLHSMANELGTNILPESVIDDQHYNRAIHIMAMLLIGFGFLMVFVRKYGRSALTATFLLVSTSLPLYMLLNTSGLFVAVNNEIERLILSEFGAASLLIAGGAVLGRLKMVGTHPGRSSDRYRRIHCDPCFWSHLRTGRSSYHDHQAGV
ncbi:MAG: hypothetical protein NTU44_19505 [Bacteroidetes bacterium]|nr:hypothetical protein [Bacteroidota bacterium]